MKVYLQCCCGGGADAIVQPGATNAVTECACGRILLWADNAQEPLAEPPSLSFSVGDNISSEDGMV